MLLLVLAVSLLLHVLWCPLNAIGVQARREQVPTACCCCCVQGFTCRGVWKLPCPTTKSLCICLSRCTPATFTVCQVTGVPARAAIDQISQQTGLRASAGPTGAFPGRFRCNGRRLPAKVLTSPGVPSINWGPRSVLATPVPGSLHWDLFRQQSINERVPGPCSAKPHTPKP